MKNQLVENHMEKRVVTVRADMDIIEVMESFVAKKITGAPVVDDRGTVLGMLSDTDCISAVLKAGYDPQWRGVVSDFMTTDVETVDAQASVTDVAERFLKRRFRRFPVVDDNRLVGQISRLEVLKAICGLRGGFA
ncbi:MAG: CBS domain-containing protein [Granulosicoccaceae bacterium]